MKVMIAIKWIIVNLQVLAEKASYSPPERLLWSLSSSVSRASLTKGDSWLPINGPPTPGDPRQGWSAATRLVRWWWWWPGVPPPQHLPHLPRLAAVNSICSALSLASFIVYVVLSFPWSIFYQLSFSCSLFFRWIISDFSIIWLRFLFFFYSTTDYFFPVPSFSWPLFCFSFISFDFVFVTCLKSFSSLVLL